MLVDAQQQAGFDQVIWNASDVTSGIYFCKLQAGYYSETKKIIFLNLTNWSTCRLEKTGSPDWCLKAYFYGMQ